MTNLTKDEAIRIASDLMEQYSSNKRYRLGPVRYEEKKDEPYWYVKFILLDEHGEIILMEPNADIVHVIDESGKAYFYANF